tara:strand:- start:390 stop:599 length:210 start_codon:yes stop_codon:yes gene_type:complete
MKIVLNDEIVEFKDSKGNVLTDEQIVRNHMLEVQKEKDMTRTWRERYFTLLNLLETTVEKEVKWSELGE